MIKRHNKNTVVSLLPIPQVKPVERTLLDPGQALVEGGDGLHHAELSLAAVGLAGPAAQQEETLGRRPVLARHEVVHDRVDGGAQVGEHHGGHVEVLAQLGRPVVVHLGEEVPADVVGQPADDEGQHHHHWKQGTRQQGAG